MFCAKEHKLLLSSVMTSQRPKRDPEKSSLPLLKVATHQSPAAKKNCLLSHYRHPHLHYPETDPPPNTEKAYPWRLSFNFPAMSSLLCVPDATSVAHPNLPSHYTNCNVQNLMFIKILFSHTTASRLIEGTTIHLLQLLTKSPLECGCHPTGSPH
eukprot:c39514_g1_i1 orf=189-653(-)